MFAVYILISLTKNKKTMTTQRLVSIEKVIKVMEMTPTTGGDYKEHYAKCSAAMPDGKDLEGLTKEEISTLECGESCPRSFSSCVTDLEEEFEIAGGTIVFTEKELKIIKLQKELRELKY